MSTVWVLFAVVAAVAAQVKTEKVPLVFQLAGPASLHPGKPVRISVGKIAGQAAAVNIKADVLSPAGVVLQKAVAFNKISGSDSDFEGSVDAKEAGFYTLALTATTQDQRLTSLSSKLKVKVEMDMIVDDMKVAIYPKDATVPSNVNIVASFSKLGKTLSADQDKKVTVSFNVKNKSNGQAFNAHQVFVIFVHESGAEIVFTGDKQKAGGYVTNINMAKEGADFNGLSGKYALRVVVGDALAKQQVDWLVADVKIDLPSVYTPTVKKSEQVIYDPLPALAHTFRAPEKRPPGVVSDAFTLICLAPLALVLVLWLAIGVNFGNMPISIWTLAFHGGLAALFGLYFVFWLQLNMFETLKYMGVVGTVTFVAGNRVLRAIADKRKQKKE